MALLYQLPPDLQKLIDGFHKSNECTNMGYLRQKSCGPPKFPWCEWNDEYGCKDKKLDTTKYDDLKIEQAKNAYRRENSHIKYRQWDNRKQQEEEEKRLRLVAYLEDANRQKAETARLKAEEIKKKLKRRMQWAQRELSYYSISIIFYIAWAWMYQRRDWQEVQPILMDYILYILSFWMGRVLRYNKDNPEDFSGGLGENLVSTQNYIEYITNKSISFLRDNLKVLQIKDIIEFVRDKNWEGFEEFEKFMTDFKSLKLDEKTKRVTTYFKIYTELLRKAIFGSGECKPESCKETPSRGMKGMCTCDTDPYSYYGRTWDWDYCDCPEYGYEDVVKEQSWLDQLVGGEQDEDDDLPWMP